MILRTLWRILLRPPFREKTNMRSLLQKRFQLQLLFALIAAVSVAALAIELVINAVRHAESFVLSDTDRTLNHALQELDHE